LLLLLAINLKQNAQAQLKNLRDFKGMGQQKFAFNRRTNCEYINDEFVYDTTLSKLVSNETVCGLYLSVCRIIIVII